MGEQALGFVNELDFPLADPLDASVEGLQRFTGTIEALVVPDIDAAPRRGPRQDRLLERLQGGRALVLRAAAVLSSGLVLSLAPC